MQTFPNRKTCLAKIDARGWPRSLGLIFFFTCLIVLPSGPLVADIVTVAWEGTFTRGEDPNNILGFGAVADLTNYTIAGTLSYDTSIAPSDSSPIDNERGTYHTQTGSGSQNWFSLSAEVTNPAGTQTESVTFPGATFFDVGVDVSSFVGGNDEIKFDRFQSDQQVPVTSTDLQLTLIDDGDIFTSDALPLSLPALSSFAFGGTGVMNVTTPGGTAEGNFDLTTFSSDPAAVPEPATTLPLLVLGVLAAMRRNRGRNKPHRTDPTR